MITDRQQHRVRRQLLRPGGQPGSQAGALADNGVLHTRWPCSGSSAIDPGSDLRVPACQRPAGVSLRRDRMRRRRVRLAPPSVSGARRNGPTTTTATVKANVNPNLKQATVFVQYGPSTGRIDDGQPGPRAGNSPAAFTAALTGLTPNTTYHARVVAGTATARPPAAISAFTTPRLGVASLVRPRAVGRVRRDDLLALRYSDGEVHRSRSTVSGT